MKKQKVTFDCTLNRIRLTNKPDGETIGKIKHHSSNQIATVSIEDLANHIQNGYSFHASILDYNLNSKVNHKGLPLTGLNDTCFVGAQLFSIDIDHGNMDFETVMAVAKQNDVEPCIVYPTMSSKQDEKRWRVLFVANRVVDKSEFDLIQRVLTFMYAKCFDATEIAGKVDFKCVDYSRLSFPSQQVGGRGQITYLQQATFDADTFIEFHETNKTLEKMEEYKLLLKNKTTNKINTTKKTDKKTNNKQPNKYKLSVSDVLQRLEGWAEESNLPHKIDIYDAFDLVNQIPLSYLISQPTHSMFSCVLPSHEDSSPSANIIENEDGLELYFCFGCGEEHGLKTFDFLTLFFKEELGYNEYTALKSIFQALNVTLGSEYQKNAKEILDYNSAQINKLGASHDLIKTLSRKGLLSTYEMLMNLTSKRLPLYSLSEVEEEKDYPTIFISTSFISQYAKSRGIIGHNDKVVVSKKINQLAKMGLIKKMALNEIDEKTLATTKEYRLKAIEREVHSIATDDKSRLRLKVDFEKHINFIMIYPLSLHKIKKAIDEYQSDKKNGVRAKGFSMKQVLAGGDVEKASTVFPQMVCKFGKEDERFMKMAQQAIEKVLSEQGYFTEKQLIRLIDTKSNYFKKADKERKFIQLEPLIRVQNNITSTTVNATNRKVYNIPNKIKSKSKIYILK